MAENDDPAAAADDTVVEPAAPAPEPAAGFTSRVWSFRAMVAVALASLVIGGGIGSAIAAISDDDDDRIRIGRFDDRNGRGPGGIPGGREFGDRFPGGGMPEFRQELGDRFDPEDLDQLKQLRQEMLKEMREQMQEWRKELREQRDDAPEVTPGPSGS